MQLLAMKNDQCIIYSAAMLLDLTPENIIDEIGHDGTSKWWKHPPPHCYRGHHIQEVIDVFLAHGKALVPIEKDPQLGCAKEPGVGRSIMEGSERIYCHLDCQPALLISPTHACAWDGSKVYDPNGRIYPLEKFNLREAWLMFQI